MTRFAISVPVGAWHPVLPDCLESLRCQEADIEVALMDASDDPRVFELAEKNDSWLTYRHHGPDAGQSDAILKGWEALRGDWLGWLNADDVLMPEATSHVVNKIRNNPQLEVIYGHSTIFDEDGAITGYHFNVEPPSERLLQAGIISQPSCFFSRAAYERAGELDQDRHYTMDWDLWIRLYKTGACFGFVDHVLSSVLWGGETKTASFNPQRRAELRSLIDEHTPQTERRGVFRAFAIHTLADMVRPKSFQRRLIRRLRRSGPRVFGLRADGQIQDEATLYLAHFKKNPKKGLSLEFSHSIPEDNITSSPASVVKRRDGRRVDLVFDRPVSAATSCSIKIRPQESAPAWFVRAQWTSE